jgi:hypothetical protein
MKTKTLLSFALLFVFVFSSLAQDVTIVQSNTDANASTYSATSKEKKPKFWIGPKYGSNFVGLPSSSSEVSSSLKEEWQAGLLMQFGRVLYVQPEAYYCMRNENPGENQITSTAVKIPAMLGLRFINLGLFSLHIMGGPQWTIPLKDSEGSYYSKQMDWMVGAGIDVLGFITADMRYIYSSDIPLSDHINNFNFKTTPLNITVGLKFR